MPETPNASDLTLYVVPNCPLCSAARAWLARHHVAYVERDVKRDFGALRAMYRLTKQNLVPVFARGGRALVRPTDKQLEEFLVNRES
jgi:arsenate reductase-like glutaredoxin family protein